METLVDARGGRMATCSAMIGIGGRIFGDEGGDVQVAVEDRRKLKKGGSVGK